MGKFLQSLAEGILDALNSNDNNSDDLSNYSYEELKEQREEVRMHCNDYEGDDWRRTLDRYDDAMRNVPRPHRDYCKTLSDDELKVQKQEAFNDYQESYKNYDTKRPYEEYYNDPEFKEIDNKYDKFSDLMLEEQRRNAEKNPDKFPRHREHGLYLPNDDD